MKLTKPQQRALVEIGSHITVGHDVARRYTHTTGSQYTFLRARHDVVERLLNLGLISLDPPIDTPGGHRRSVYVTTEGVEVLSELHRKGVQS